MNIYILSDKKINGAKNIPVIDITYIQQDIDYNLYNSLIITSKNALYSIDSMNEKWKNIPIYAIAPQTANIVKKLGGNLEFIGTDGHGDKFALELIDKLKGKKALYIRGEKVVSNLINILKQNNISCDETIVYKTVCKEYKQFGQLPKDSIIIFSSPSTIKCFFKNTTWDESFKAVCIGDTTAKYLPSHIKPYIADTTSLESCVEKGLELNSYKQ